MLLASTRKYVCLLHVGFFPCLAIRGKKISDYRLCLIFSTLCLKQFFSTISSRQKRLAQGSSVDFNISSHAQPLLVLVFNGCPSHTSVAGGLGMKCGTCLWRRHVRESKSWCRKQTDFKTKSSCYKKVPKTLPTLASSLAKT